MSKMVIRGLIVAALMIAGVTVASAQRPILGGYQSASVSDEEVIAAANFAVDKRSEETEGLELDEILKAESQVVAGRNFRLCLRVKLGDDTQDVQVVVFRSLQGDFTLRSWNPAECAE